MFFFEIVKAMLFGIVEGITEWLPVSSTGHLILLNDVIGLNVSHGFYEVFEVVIQLGAILAVLVYFRKKLSPFGKSGEEKRQTLRLWRLSVLGVIPSAVAGLLLDDLLDTYLYDPPTVAIMLIIYGIAFIAVERAKKGTAPRLSQTSELTVKDAFAVGLFQMLALIPGTSRSGATILGGYLCGLSRPVAAEFSFFLAIPTMLGAGGLKTAKFFIEENTPTLSEGTLLLVAALTAFGVSLIAIKFLTELVRRHSFSGFGIYRIALGALVLIYHFTGRL